jgi:hypothetical protein
MRRADAIFVGIAAVASAIGGVLGWQLASRTSLETYKLLAIVGQTYSLLGFLVLSELVTSSERWRHFVVRWVAGVLLWGQTLVPLGAAAGAFLHHSAPSSGKVAGFFGTFLIYSILPLGVLDATMFYPRMQHLQDLKTRVRRFGFMLLLAGAVVQLFAAFLDFYG